MTARETSPSHGSNEWDVVIIGAGVSGVGAAHHLATQHSTKSYLLLDAMEDFGGTWRLHKYPGARSDSDLYTYGYRFKPWVGRPIASSSEILDYLGDVIAEHGLRSHMKFGTRVRNAAWSSADARWKLEVESVGCHERSVIYARFLWMCQGYYRHSTGYVPQWVGLESYAGRLVHPQQWPEDLAVRDQRILVVGSGATAATLVPALAKGGANVTMLQRSPSYFAAPPNRDAVAEKLASDGVDASVLHATMRSKNLAEHRALMERGRDDSAGLRNDLLAAVRAQLDDDALFNEHFKPRYRAYSQRIAVIPDGDLFAEIRAGRVRMITNEIDRFTPSGVILKSGQRVDADVVVTATGFHLCPLGDISFSVDGANTALCDTMTYRGVMCSGLPNLAWIFGYFKASWTLRVDLVSDFVCRLLQHMQSVGARIVRVVPASSEWDGARRPWFDVQDFAPSYLQRGMEVMPRAGVSAEWCHSQNFWLDQDEFPNIDLTAAPFSYE